MSNKQEIMSLVLEISFFGNPHANWVKNGS